VYCSTYLVIAHPTVISITYIRCLAMIALSCKTFQYIVSITIFSLAGVCSWKSFGVVFAFAKPSHLVARLVVSVTCTFAADASKL